MKTQTVTAIRFLLVLTILTGLIYPLIMTGTSQLVFPYRSGGSLILKDGRIIGSELIGQRFDSSIYFWSRPSAIGYNPVPSGSSNLGPTSETLKKQASYRRNLFVIKNSIADSLNIPREMIFASGSGLDPHISPEAALLQVERICKARNLSSNQKEGIIEMIAEMTEGPQYFVLGESRINVLRLNLELDKFTEKINKNK
jgi:K+-transporting ATPase ATPase C chain